MNKTSTRAEIRVAIVALGGIHPEAVVRLRERAAHMLVRSSDEIRVVSDEHRSQVRNREACLQKLRALIEGCEPRPRARRKTKPTRASRERRLKEKKQHSRKKQDRNWRGDDR